MPKRAYETVPRGTDLIEKLTQNSFGGLERVREYAPTGVNGKGQIFHFNNSTLVVNNSDGFYPLQVFAKSSEQIEKDARNLSRIIGVELKLAQE